MYDIFVTSHFAGAHHLRDYPGDCEHPHGHNWKVVVTVRATKLDQLGMAIDFKLLKKYLGEVVDTLDHRDLNEHPAFQTVNPSSEYIAKYIYDLLLPKLASDRYHLYSVGVSETETSSLIYYGEN